MRRDEIVKVLTDLLKLEDVLACQIARKGLEGVIPPGLKIKDVGFWLLLRKTTDMVFDLIEQFFDYKLDRLYFEMGKYTVIIATISKSISLIVVIPSLANMGLLDVEIENAKRKIVEIMQKKDPEQKEA